MIAGKPRPYVLSPVWHRALPRRWGGKARATGLPPARQEAHQGRAVAARALGGQEAWLNSAIFVPGCAMRGMESQCLASIRGA